MTYDEVALMDAAVSSVVVDMAGNAGVLRSIHGTFGDRLAYSCRVGVTHRERQDGGGSLLRRTGPSCGPRALRAS